MRNRAMLLGITAALVLFLAVTALAAHLQSDCGIGAVIARLTTGQSICADDIVRVGFPFVSWEVGGFAYRSIIDSGALLLDLLTLAVTMVAGALIAHWIAHHAS